MQATAVGAARERTRNGRTSVVFSEEVVTHEHAPEACDCPCHRGSPVFHVVSCCGSLLTFPLWRSEPRDPLASEADLEHSGWAVAREG
jgi:hypothetical protein